MNEHEITRKIILMGTLAFGVGSSLLYTLAIVLWYCYGM